MNEQIVWKEARSNQGHSDEDNEASSTNDDNDLVYNDANLASTEHEEINTGKPTTVNESGRESTSESYQGATYFARSKKFSHQRIDLKLRRNIVALAEDCRQKPKPNFSTNDHVEQFENCLENALVTISPDADFILFAAQSPEKIVFFAKLRMEPIDQYTTKTLDVPLDYDEHVTSLLCLPIMSSQRTSLGSVDWMTLVIGLSSGYVKFYTEQSICLLSLKFCDEPVVSIKCQTQKNNSNARSQTHFASIVDELLITYRSCAILTDGIGLYENLRISKDDITKSNSNYEPAYTLTNLPTILTCQKWKFQEARDSRILDADIFGMRCTTRFDSLRSDSINSDYVPAKACTRTLAFVGRNPFLSCYKEAKETASHSYTEIIGSLLPFWSKPQQTRVQMNEITHTSNTSFFDKGRLATTIVPSPDKRLAAITDDFGRVMLVDVTNWLLVRIWKGYRSAQCGWIEVKRNPEERGSPHATFIVIYAPKRGLLEIWSVQRGPRVAAFNTGKSCRLLYSGYKMLNMRAESTLRAGNINLLVDQSYSSNCYLLNAKTGTVYAIELPYTYSLYKYGDLKSRDYLLIGELNVAIQQDAEVKVISEILHRIILAESLQTSIQKIVLNLIPDKIVPIMENLVNKIMKNYDNDSGGTMTDDDMSIVDLCKRLIRLCSIFHDLSKSTPSNLTLPDVNQRLIDGYEEHPQEIDEFAEQLGWNATEILRYLSLLALDQSYRKNYEQNPWPNMGEPLTWSEFISCFDLSLNSYKFKSNNSRNGSKSMDRLSIKLKECNSKFLTQDKVVKTALFMYNRLSENFYRSLKSTKQLDNYNKDFLDCYTYLEPSSRLALLFQFWLTTKLCNHWKMWAFLQNQVGRISDELKVILMEQSDDKLLIETWKQIYHLILESDNIYAAIIATATIRSDTLKTIDDNEKRKQLEDDHERDDADKDDQKLSSIDWECLCIDAERMSILSQQLEDVFLLNLLLRYSPTDGCLVDNYIYRVPRISVANILRAGPTAVSELVAQWAAQSGVNLNIFTQFYGDIRADEVIISGPSVPNLPGSSRDRSRLISSRAASLDNNEHAKELLHHVKTSFPRSLEPNIILLNCVWELCRRWTTSGESHDKTELLNRAFESLSLLGNNELKHNLASAAYKTFFQRTFERLVILVETNATLLNPKSSRTRDALIRKELNMGEDCLEDFVQFYCNLSEFVLQTCNDTDKLADNLDQSVELFDRLSVLDDWWSTPTVVKMLNDPSRPDNMSRISSAGSIYDTFEKSERQNCLVKASLSCSNLLDVNTLVELNRLANLMSLIFKLKIIKPYPLSLIGEESRHVLRFDLQQSPTSGADMRTRSRSVNELRRKFARKCILSMVAKISEESNEMPEEEYGSGNRAEEEEEDIDMSGEKKQLAPLDWHDKGQATLLSLNERAKQQEQAGGKSGKPIKALVGSGSKVASSSNSGSCCYLPTISSNKLATNENNDVYEWNKDENNESLVLFTNLLSLANEWRLDCDELYLEFVFELYRCNHDKIASQISTRIQDRQTLANGLLKIASQRVLVLFGLSPQISDTNHWRQRIDKWSLFQPNVANWLKSIQQEEIRHEIASLSFSDSLKPTSTISTSSTKTSINVEEDLSDFTQFMEHSFGVQLFVLNALRLRTKLVLESVTNYLDGQAGKLAYDLLQMLESQLFDKFLLDERKMWSEQSNKTELQRDSRERQPKC